jgi:hypothetical protein
VVRGSGAAARPLSHRERGERKTGKEVCDGSAPSHTSFPDGGWAWSRACDDRKAREENKEERLICSRSPRENDEEQPIDGGMSLDLNAIRKTTRFNGLLPARPQPPEKQRGTTPWGDDPDASWMWSPGPHPEHPGEDLRCMGTSTPKMGKGTPMSLRSILLDAGPRRDEGRFSSCGS